MKNIILQKMASQYGFDVYVGIMDIESLKGRFFSKPLKHEDDNMAMYSEDSSLGSDDSIENHEFLEINDRVLVQREQIPSKIRKIDEYLDEDLGFFPNSIIFGIQNSDSKKVEFNQLKEFNGDFYSLSFNSSEDKILFIIDGQHRIEGAFRNYYRKLIAHIQAILEANNDSKSIEKLKNILLEKVNNNSQSITSKIEELAKYVEEKYSQYIFENKLNRFKMNFSVVIFHDISKSKMIEIFTDINSSATRLNTNLTRYFYGRFTTKEPFLKIAINVGKFLNETKDSPLYGYIKMPYKFKDDNSLTQVSIGAFCQRLEQFSGLELAGKKKLNRVNFYMKPFGVLIFNKFIRQFDTKNYLNGKLYTKESVDQSTIFLFRFLAYSFRDFRDLFSINLINEKNKFIDSSTIELYMYIVQEIFVNLILSKIDLDELLEKGITEKDELKKLINEEFKDNFKEPLLETFTRYNFFTKGSKDNSGTGGGKSSEIVNFFKGLYFSNSVIGDNQSDSIEEIEKLKSIQFNKVIIKYYAL